jgi:predicted metal-dependent hydrolase
VPDVQESIATLDAPGGSIVYTLRRTPRARGLRVTIDDRRGIVVSVPPPTRRGWTHPEPLVERFLREREAWMRRYLERQAANRAALRARGDLGAGSSIRFRGVMHTLEVLPAAGAHSEVARHGDDDGDRIVVHLARRDQDRLRAVLAGWLMDRAALAIDHEIGRHGRAMGVAPTAVAIRDPRTRWGSASRDRRLMFSWRLVLAPPVALETVVVHELAHLRVFGHGPAFWDLVAARRSDHREWRQWLRQHSYELHHALDQPS